VGCCCLFQHAFDIATHQVLRRPALDAQKMMVVAAVAQLIVQVAIFQQDPAQDTGLYE
jgi:hypothetical protein